MPVNARTPTHAENRPGQAPAGAPTVAGWRRLLIATGILVACVALFAGIGSGQDPLYGAFVVAWTVGASYPALLYVLSAIGLGVLFDPLARGLPERWAVRAGLGLALQLTLSHTLGWAGVVLSGPIWAWVPVAAGLAMLVFAIARERRAPPSDGPPGGIGLLACAALALMLVAACSAPGWLWSSEFGGFDALSYHLPLPQEWIALGRVVPLEHSVYSYLPGYVEAAFAHVGVLMGARPSSAPGLSWGLLEGDGQRALACQMLHVFLSVLAAWISGRAAHALARRSCDERGSRLCARCTSGFVLATPWAVVVGSLAYNEMAMLAILGAAMIVAFNAAAAPARSATLCALLVGVACGVKPTAIFMVGLPVGVILLGSVAPRHWAVVAIAGTLAGLAALAPWLIRNFSECANPVFPYAAGLFGRGHWTAEQAARFAGAHRFDGNLLQRLLLIFMPDPSDPAGPRHRGILHPQWAGFGPLLLASVCVLIARAGRRKEMILLAVAVGAQLLAWLLTTHIQSRFLLPMLVPGAVLISLVLRDLTDELAMVQIGPLTRWVPNFVLGAPVAVQLLFSTATFVQDRGGNPNATLLPGPGVFSGEALRPEFERATPPDRTQILNGAPAEVVVNLRWPDIAKNTPGARLYLLGDSTPFYLAVPLFYHTTWDNSPFADAVRAAPDNPVAWARALLDRGLTHVLIDRRELVRLSRNKWSDPDATPEAAERFVTEACTLLEEWALPSGEKNRGLYRINDPPSAGPDAPTPEPSNGAPR